MEAGKKTIGEVFAKQRILEIPFFQRSYVWDEENWERFLEDMATVSTQNAPYFMGSLILKQEKKSRVDRLLIDGQQRLTTIVLFFKEMCIMHNQDTLFNFVFCNMQNKVALRHNHNDVEIFESIVKDGDISKSLEEKYADNKVLQCYKFFQAKENNEIMRDIILDNILANLYFLGIDLWDDDDEQQIFDTINSLGVRLTNAELLKNELFKRGDEALFEEKWKCNFEGDSKAFWDKVVTSVRSQRSNIDMLLQSYLLIDSSTRASEGDVRGGKKEIGNQFRDWKVYIKKESITADKNKRDQFVCGLVDCAKNYQEIINPRLLDEDIDIDSPKERMNLAIFGLNTTTVIPYLLYVQEANPDSRDKIFSLLESYIVRRVIAKESNRGYYKFFASLIQSGVKDFDDLRQVIDKQTDQALAFPSDESLKEGFTNNNLTNQLAKTVLYLIEKNMRDKNEVLTLFGLNKYELEHIMPKKWRNHWPGDLGEQKSRERDQALRKLGNLTIITPALNKTIRDSSWEIKKNGKGKKKGLLAYSKGMQIFDREEYLHSDHWDEEKIKERGEFLFAQAKKIWPYEK